MKIEYDKETDSLYIQLRPVASVESEEVQPGIVFDFASDGKLTGIDIEHASSVADVTHLPALG